MTTFASSVKTVPAVDESSFQRLLAAAYVVQQHNDGLRARQARLETSQVLSQIAEIESLARTCSLEVGGVCALAADRLRKMTDAAGVSIGLVSDGYLDCVAESGVPAKIPGSSIASHSIVATERLKSGELFESDNAENDIRLDVSLCRELKTDSLIAAPVHCFRELSGLVEVRWDHAKAFLPGDARACRLIAELITATLERGSRNDFAGRAALSSELSPDSVAERDSDDFLKSAAETGELQVKESAPPEGQQSPENVAECCRVCGKEFGVDEVFCGNCSMPRIAAGPGDGLQSKWASMWYMQQAHDAREPREASVRTQPRWLVPTAIKPAEPQPAEPQPAEPKAVAPAPAVGEVMRSIWSRPSGSTAGESASPRTHSIAVNLNALLDPEDAGVMQRVSQRIGMFRQHPIASFISAAALFLVVSVWAISPSPGNGQITRLESLLVELGLAEVPANAPAAAGRPEARVWVDVHTALYYCEGSDLYGKTPEGRFTTQREAQQDQFQPASQLPCK